MNITQYLEQAFPEVFSLIAHTEFYKNEIAGQMYAMCSINLKDGRVSVGIAKVSVSECFITDETPWQSANDFAFAAAFGQLRNNFFE